MSDDSPSKQPPFHAQSPEDVVRWLEVDLERGLDQSAVRQRRDEHGPNQLREASRRSAWAILVDQFTSVVLLVLGVAAVGAMLMGEWPEAIAIGAVFVVNGLIGFFSEWKAVRSMEALRKMGQPHVRVRRGGEPAEVPVGELVPGDVVLQEGGDIVPADMRLVESNNLRIDESALTGESVPVNKRLDAVEPDAPLAERHDMLYRGTIVTEGSGEGVVVATGMATELGRIAEMAEQAESESTPLQRRLDQLGARLAWITLAIAVVIAGVGVGIGRDTTTMIATAIALGLAAIPEGLPIVSTIALARGMWLMAKRNALINRLTAVETLGATQVIFTDKTGTLTRNRMMLRSVVTPQGDEQLDPDAEQRQSPEERFDRQPWLRRILEVGALCSNAVFHDPDRDADAEEEQGDPTELALVQAAADFEMWRDQLLKEKPEVREVAFDSDVMMMATFHEDGDRVYQAIKGAPQSVLGACAEIAAEQGDGQFEPLDDDRRQQWTDRAESLAHDGLRVLAIADRQVDSAEVEPYESLRFLGLVGLYDPPAEAVAQSIAECHRAGVRVVMVTGDQPATARAIGHAVGITDDPEAEAVHGRELLPPDELDDEQRKHLLGVSIFARVTPEQKLHLVELHQQAGHIVAMTGDGINDAPALKTANIGVAMGRRGTDAAREASDMVLKDDAFSSIVAAIEQGRVIFGNIRKSVMFMLCTNVAEVLAVSIAAFAGLTLPLKPLQILFLNVLTDVFPALALGVGKGESEAGTGGSVMDRPPRPSDERVITGRHWAAIGGWAALICACVLAALLTGEHQLAMETPAAVTVSFLTLGLSKLWFVFNLRDRSASAWNNEITRNGWIWASIVQCLALLATAVYLPGLSDVLQTRPLALDGWGLALAFSVIPLVVGQVILALWRLKPSEETTKDTEGTKNV